MKAKFFPTLEVLAVASLAYRQSGNKIIRDTITEGDRKLYPNRVIIEHHFTNQSQVIVTNHDCEAAKGMQTYLEQTVIVQSLKSSPDRFLGQMAELISKPEISNRDFGLVAWAPHLVNQYQRKDRVREISARYEHTSRYIGTVGQKITTDFTLIEKRYIKSMDCYVVYGYDANDNLIQYWARTLDKICEVGKIIGRIKAHNEDEYHNNARITVMNYVKVV